MQIFLLLIDIKSSPPNPLLLSAVSQGDGIVSEFFPIPEVKCEALSDPWHVYMHVFTQWISLSTFSLPGTAVGCGDY